MERQFWNIGMVVTGSMILYLLYVACWADVRSQGGQETVDTARSILNVLTFKQFNLSAMSIRDFQYQVLFKMITVPAMLVHLLEALVVSSKAKRDKFFYFGRTFLCGFTSWGAYNAEMEEELHDD